VSTPLSAKNAQVRIGSYVFTAKSWRVNPTSDALDITNYEGGGFADFISGIIQAEFTIEADWDSAADPFANPPNIVVGAVLTNTALYTNLASPASAHWSFPSALVTETPFTAVIRETLFTTVTCKSKGIFQYP
jgi:hypothetical protein